MPEEPKNAFIGKTDPPAAKELKLALGPTQPLWDELLADLARDHGIDPEGWNSYSPKAGWSMPLRLGKRRILYLSPCRSCFRASFALGDKAVATARKSGLPRAVIQLIDTAKRYAEGTAVRIDVRNASALATVKKLAAIKLEN